MSFQHMLQVLDCFLMINFGSLTEFNKNIRIHTVGKDISKGYFTYSIFPEYWFIRVLLEMFLILYWILIQIADDHQITFYIKHHKMLKRIQSKRPSTPITLYRLLLFNIYCKYSKIVSTLNTIVKKVSDV